MRVVSTPSHTFDILNKSGSHKDGVFNHLWGEANKVESCSLKDNLQHLPDVPGFHHFHHCTPEVLLNLELRDEPQR